MSRLRDTDVRLDAAHERLLAPGEVEAVGLRGGEADLLEQLDAIEVLGHLGHGAPEPLRVLLARDDRESEYLRSLDEDRGVVPTRSKSATAGRNASWTSTTTSAARSR